MSVSGLCEICEQAQAVDRCERCGAVVCREHLAEGLGFCTRCAAEVQGDDPTPGEGGDTFRF